MQVGRDRFQYWILNRLWPLTKIVVNSLENIVAYVEQKPIVELLGVHGPITPCYG